MSEQGPGSEEFKRQQAGSDAQEVPPAQEADFFFFLSSDQALNRLSREGECGVSLPGGVCGVPPWGYPRAQCTQSHPRALGWSQVG